MKRSVIREEYFTPVVLAQACVDLVEKYFSLDQFDLVIEPSAGTGNFLVCLPAKTRIGIDIMPRHSEVIEADFLDWNPPGDAKSILTIGNPPFGQRASLAVKFMQRACEFSEVVAFILPRSFNKYTFQNRVPSNFHLVDSFECDKFLRPDGQTVTVNAVFQIWQRLEVNRELDIRPNSHKDFCMKHGHISRLSEDDMRQIKAEYEFAIAQVGSNFAPRSIDEIQTGSHWFIKPNAAGVRERFTKLDFSFLDGMNTAHKSLSRRDIISAYIAVEEMPGK